MPSGDIKVEVYRVALTPDSHMLIVKAGAQLEAAIVNPQTGAMGSWHVVSQAAGPIGKVEADGPDLARIEYKEGPKTVRASLKVSGKEITISP